MKLWDFLEGRTLFEAVDPRVVKEYDDETHLAYITSLLGPAPKDLVGRGKRTSMFYTAAGKESFNEIIFYTANTAFQERSKTQTLSLVLSASKALSPSSMEKRRRCLSTSSAG